MQELIYRYEFISISPQSETFKLDLEYCAGLDDYENMGIAVISTWASWKLPGRRLEAFTNERLEEFQKLVDKADKIIGFNSLIFDDLLCQAKGISINTDYDLLREILGEVINLGLYTKYKDYWRYKDIADEYPIVTDYTLEALAKVNLSENFQSVSYEPASRLYFIEEYQKVIDNCLHKVLQIKKLYDLHSKDKIFDPVSSRPVSRKFPIPVSTKSLYQKLIALGLGAFFCKDGNYAFLRKFSDYEHYALLCNHINISSSRKQI
ncbi:hypothetical protein NIES4071_02180 [Calothrix sp. NIES-4071]|nr:hypothetical protein NIES4071_02180 [Calothrix sp. NIES-4071]BAZ54564.1 hypothetical protein NIES4105_02170 [Calothrix sp. NIES-4105]